MKNIIYRISCVALLLTGMVLSGCKSNNNGDNKPTVYPNIVVTNSTDNTITLDLGEEFTVEVDFDDDRKFNCEDYCITYSSGNRAIFTVDETTGVIRAVAVGEATLSLKTAENSKITGVCTIRVVDRMAAIDGGLQVTNCSGNEIDLETTDQYTLEIAFEDEYDYDIADYTLYFESEDTNIFTVTSETGVITAVAEGEAYVYVGIREAENIYVRCKIKVTTKPVPVLLLTNVTGGEIDLEAEETFTVAVAFEDPVKYDLADYTLVYESGNTAVFTVGGSSGQITAVAGGEAYLTVTTVENPSIHASCKVKVTDKAVPNLRITNATDNVITVKLGQTFAVAASFEVPSDDALYTLAYQSGTPGIFTVNAATGVITAGTVGEAILTVKTLQDETIYTTCQVRVVAPSALSITNATDNIISLQRTDNFGATASFANAADNDLYTLVYSSGNPGIFTVNAETGVITGVAEGQSTLTVRAQESAAVYATCIVKVTRKIPVPHSALVITSATDNVITIERGKQLAVGVNFANPALDNISDYTLSFTSGNPGLFTVTPGTGIITAAVIGEATLYVKTMENEDVTASCKVKVVAPEAVVVTAIDISYPDYIRIGMNEKFDLGAYVSISPKKATFKDVVFTSKKENIALVDEFGIVTGFNYGHTAITVSSLDGTVTATCYVHVSYYGFMPLERTGWTVTSSQPTTGTPASLIDDSNSSYLQLTKPGVSGIPANHIPYFILDMKAPQKIEFFALRHRTDNTYDWLRVWTASIYGSDNGVDFTPIALNIEVPHAQGVDVNPTISFPPTTCRYFKFVCNTWKIGSGSAICITDFQLGRVEYFPEIKPEKIKEWGAKIESYDRQEF